MNIPPKPPKADLRTRRMRRGVILMALGTFVLLAIAAVLLVTLAAGAPGEPNTVIWGLTAADLIGLAGALTGLITAFAGLLTSIAALFTSRAALPPPAPPTRDGAPPLQNPESAPPPDRSPWQPPG
jgi:hypothetical protein